MQLPLFKDARYFQILFQLVFLGTGIFFLHWAGDCWLYCTYFIAAIVLQAISELIFMQHTQIAFVSIWWKKFCKGFTSVLISSFGLCLLLKTDKMMVAVLASAIAVLSKYVVRFRGKHIFNPSALGIALTVWFTESAWISPGQWGSGIVLLFAVCSFGFVITTKVQKAGVSIAFLGTFAVLLFARQVFYLGWPMDYFLQSVSSGSLLLFSFFMITDPKTTPNHRVARVIWAMLVAVIAFYLTAFRFVNGAPIFVLVCAQPVVPLLDSLFKAARFEWTKSSFTSAPIHPQKSIIIL